MKRGSYIGLGCHFSLNWTDEKMKMEMKMEDH